MTDVQFEKKASEAAAGDLAAMEEQIQQLADRARAEGLRLTGEGDPLSQPHGREGGVDRVGRSCWCAGGSSARPGCRPVSPQNRAKRWQVGAMTQTGRCGGRCTRYR